MFYTLKYSRFLWLAMLKSDHSTREKFNFFLAEYILEFLMGH